MLGHKWVVKNFDANALAFLEPFDTMLARLFASNNKEVAGLLTVAAEEAIEFAGDQVLSKSAKNNPYVFVLPKTDGTAELGFVFQNTAGLLQSAILVSTQHLPWLGGEE